MNPNQIQTASASSTLTFLNLPAVDLIEFELLGILPTNAGATLQMQVSINNGSSWINTGYYFAKNMLSTSATASTEAGNNTSRIDLGKLTTFATSGGSGSGVVQLFNPGSSTAHKVVNWHLCTPGSGELINIVGAGSAQQNTSVVNAVKFYFDTTTIASGKIAMRPRRATVTN